MIAVFIIETENTFKISVVDQGEGMDEEVKKKMFSPYAKISKSGTEHIIGLGLTITRKLVEKLNGKLRIESQPGTGSTFIVEFFK